MRLEEEKKGGILVIRPLEARIDARGAPEFKRRGLELIGQSNKKVLVDLSAVDFVDSSGLGALVSFLKALGREGIVALCSLKGTVREVLKLTRLESVFHIFSDEEEALRALLD